MVINNLLAQQPGMRVQRIAYMGAACSIRDWMHTVFPYLRGEPGHEAVFYNESLNRIREESERNGVFLGGYFDVAPRGSLLNWIDAYYGNPVSLSDRTLGSWENVMRLAPLIPLDLRNRLYFHSFDALSEKDGPSKSQPQSHGALAQWPFWEMDYLFPQNGNNQLVPAAL
jgi:hypothetical protein